MISTIVEDEMSTIKKYYLFLAFFWMVASPEIYREMGQQSDKCGDYEIALQHLRDLYDACKKCPEATIRIT